MVNHKKIIFYELNNELLSVIGGSIEILNFINFLGEKAEIKKYDLYLDKDTGQLWNFRKGGKGNGIPTGEYIN